jgi:ABC-2 type transport system permease protein
VPRQAPGGPFGGGQPPEPKGDLRPLLDLLAIEWPTTDIVWNPYNPLQQNPDLPPEVIFIGKGSTKDAFNEDDVLTEGLQEVVGIFAGALRPRGGPGPEFTPLLRTSKAGGIVPYDQLTRRGMFGGVSINNDRPHIPTGQAYTIAAHIKGDPAPSSIPADKEKKDAKPAKLHAVAIADLDMVSEEFFNLRRQKIESLDLDNVTFVLNCVDVLAGDDDFVALRKKRLHHRTLTRLEAQMKDFVSKFQDETKLAEDEAKEQLDLAQKSLNKEVAAVRARTDVDDRTKEILLGNLEEVANRRLDVQKANIEDKKRRKIYESKADSEVKTRGIRNSVRWQALLEAAPPIALGLVIFGLRVRRENYGANPNRIA